MTMDDWEGSLDPLASLKDLIIDVKGDKIVEWQFILDLKWRAQLKLIKENRIEMVFSLFF